MDTLESAPALPAKREAGATEGEGRPPAGHG